MHEISDKTLQGAREHALQAEQYGEQLRSTANHLRQSGQISEVQREQVERYVELMQESVQGMLDAVDAAYKERKNSVEAYALAVEHHIKANQHHMSANQFLIDLHQRKQAQSSQEN